MLSPHDYLIVYGCVFVLASAIVVAIDFALKFESTPRQNIYTAVILVAWPLFLLLSPLIVKRQLDRMQRHQQRCDRSDHSECEWKKKGSS